MSYPKPAKVQFTDGETRKFEHVDPKEQYVFLKEERDGDKYHRYVPWHQIIGIMRIYSHADNDDGKVKARENVTIQEAVDDENESLLDQ